MASGWWGGARDEGGLWAGGGGGELGLGRAGDGNDVSASNAIRACVAGSAGNAGRDGVVSKAWVEWVDEPVAGYPKRAVPTASAPLKELGRRTLTNLYNERPRWLDNAHKELDAAVGAAYGWASEISDDDVLRELLKLNSKRHLACQ